MHLRSFYSDFVTELRRSIGRGSSIFRSSVLKRDEDGGALVEFTVLAPLFFLIVFGIIEWGMIFYLQNNMVNGAREGARTAAVQASSSMTSAQQVAAANNAACRWMTGAGQTFVITSSDGCTGANAGQQDITVRMSVDAASASIFNYLSMFTGRTLNASVTMRKEIACQSAGTSATCNCNTTNSPPTGC